MKINVPSEEEAEKTRRSKIKEFGAGVLIGIILFSIAGSRLFLGGIENIGFYTWIALGVGVLAFGFLAMLFRSDFWDTLKRLFGL